MSRSLRFTPNYTEALEHLLDEIASSSPKNTSIVASAIADTVKQLPLLPTLGSQVNEDRPELRRITVKKNVVIYYEVSTGFVDLITIAHGRQNRDTLRFD